MYKHIAFLICFCVAVAAVKAQSEFSAEYVHGFGKNFNENLIGARYEGFNDHSSWGLGINYNFASICKGKENTKSKGWGIYADYHYGFNPGLTGNPFVGLRAAFGFNKDNKGNSYSVFTPSLQFGYHYTSQDFNKGGAFTPYGALGYDIKLDGAGKAKDVHEGVVFLPGFTAGYRF
jgi:hypothetical protein